MACREESALLCNDCLFIFRHAKDYCFRGYLPSIPDRRSGGNELIRAALAVVRRYFLTRSAAAIHLLSMDKLL